MDAKKRARLEGRVAQAVAGALDARQFVSAIDVLVGIGWLSQSHVDDWRHGRLPVLEAGVQANLAKISAAMHAFHAWTGRAKLKPSETAYVARSRSSWAH